ncbi:MAG: hypothetical protein ACKOW2_01850 [Sphingobacteriaceae bacterium]
MKKLLILTLVLFAIGFNACKKDKKTPAQLLKEQMTGKWIYDKYQSENFNAQGNSLGAPTVYDYDDLIAYVEFKSDGTQVVTTNGQDINNDTWEIIDGQSFKIGTYTEKVVNISASNFVYVEENVQPDGSKTVYTYTLKH